jgi:hypothetical protein
VDTNFERIIKFCKHRSDGDDWLSSENLNSKVEITVKRICTLTLIINSIKFSREVGNESKKEQLPDFDNCNKGRKLDLAELKRKSITDFWFFNRVRKKRLNSVKTHFQRQKIFAQFGVFLK